MSLPKPAPIAADPYEGDDATDRAAFGHLPGYNPPPGFDWGRWDTIARVPARGDGADVVVEEVRMPARAFRLRIAPTDKHPGAVLATGTGVAGLAGALAQAFSEGMLTVDELPGLPPSRALLHTLATTLEDLLAGATPAVSVRECLAQVRAALAAPPSTHPLFTAARAFLEVATFNEDADRDAFDVAEAELEAELAFLESGDPPTTPPKDAP